jgi:signal transduction histidine kinase
VASTYHGSLTLADLPIGRSAAPAPTAAAGSTLSLGGETVAYSTLPLGTDANGSTVVVYLLDSVTRALSPLESIVGRQFAIYGLIAALLVGLAGSLLARTFLGPLDRFVAFMRSVATSRDYTVRFDASGAGREIRTLNAGYDSLIGSLERQHSELVARSTELSHANEALWQQMQERERIQHALEESEKQLRQSQKLEAVGTLAGGVAHDFNNLLTVIIGHSQMMFETMTEDNPLQKDLSQIRAAADRAASLTRQLLAFSRKQILKPKTLDLVVVVQGMRNLMRRLIGEDIDLKIWLPSTPAWVLADPTQLEQVLMNLAVNARDAMPHGGTLTIEVAVVPATDPAASFLPPNELGVVQLSVRDTGVGMDELTKERIFEPFFTTKGPGRGTGLGLSTVYGIVEQSGGEITVESKPGHGAEFRVRLPEAPPAPAEGAESADGQGHEHGHETILLVEDEPDVRRLAARALTQHGYVVLEANGGVEALEIARRYRGPVNLLVTDVVMPGLNGKEVLAKLLETRADTRALFMSGYPADIIANRGLLDSNTAFLQKPFTPSVFLQRVRATLDGQLEASGAAA